MHFDILYYEFTLGPLDPCLYFWYICLLVFLSRVCHVRSVAVAFLESTLFVTYARARVNDGN